ncbi:MAG: SDR family oxidoreductase [Chitinophagales bacterium]|nr:SDR family oxidoreductase [Chitinophagales bacterium]
MVLNEAKFANTSVLITGGAGFIGCNIAEEFLNKGVKVRVMDNFITGRRSNIEPFLLHPNFELYEGDIRSENDCKKAVEGMDLVCHQAALGSVPRSISNPSATNDINVGGFVNMLFAAKEAGIKRFVYASSSSVYGDEPNLPKQEHKIGNPLSPYAVSKLTNELYAKVFALTYGMEIIGLRYFNVYGPKQDPDGPYAAVIPLFIKCLMENTAPYINGDGEQTRDFTYVANAVQANMRALFTDNTAALNQVYNVAVGENFTVNDMYRRIKNYLNKDIDAIHRAPREGDVRNSLADISKAQNLLGYTPEFSFDNGLPLTIEYFKKIFV